MTDEQTIKRLLAERGNAIDRAHDATLRAQRLHEEKAALVAALEPCGAIREALIVARALADNWRIHWSRHGNKQMTEQADGYKRDVEKAWRELDALLKAANGYADRATGPKGEA